MSKKLEFVIIDKAKKKASKFNAKHICEKLVLNYFMFCLKSHHVIIEKNSIIGNKCVHELKACVNNNITKGPKLGLSEMDGYADNQRFGIAMCDSQLGHKPCGKGFLTAQRRNRNCKFEKGKRSLSLTGSSTQTGAVSVFCTRIFLESYNLPDT